MHLNARIIKNAHASTNAEMRGSGGTTEKQIPSKTCEFSADSDMLED